jgi:sodium-dependent dicarboxylate transporter 2/3/5
VLTRGLHEHAVPVIAGLGRWRPKERRVLVVFALTAALWVTRTEPWGGWSGVLHSGAGDATVALVAVVVMFLVPDGEGGELLDWPTAARIPWGLLLLFGGGIAIARAFKDSGLSEAVAGGLGAVTSLPAVWMILVTCLAVTFLTEVTSNTATATLLMPVLAAVATGAGLDPAVLMAPAALSASCAFMLPVATAPNAIVFGTDRVTTSRMAREGLWINLLGAVAITAVAYVRLI